MTVIVITKKKSPVAHLLGLPFHYIIIIYLNHYGIFCAFNFSQPQQILKFSHQVLCIYFYLFSYNTPCFLGNTGLSLVIFYNLSNPVNQNHRYFIQINILSYNTNRIYKTNIIEIYFIGIVNLYLDGKFL